MRMEAGILCNNNMLQVLSQIRKFIGDIIMYAWTNWYISYLLVLQQYFHSTSIDKSINDLVIPEIVFPEYARSKPLQLMHVPHIKGDSITIIYIFKNFY